MDNLAVSYSQLGMHVDALAMWLRVLEFRRRVLPENHPDIGEGHVSLRHMCGDACTLLCTVEVDSFLFSHGLVQH